MGSATENAAARRARATTRHLTAEGLRARGRTAFTDDFRRIDRRSLVAMPETDSAGFIEQLLAWFEIDDGAPTFHVDEVIDTLGDRAVLYRLRVAFPSGQRSEFLQIYVYDEPIECLELVIAYDLEDLDLARREFADLTLG